jgi:thiamine biosynthesis lipoprotein
LWTVLSRSDGLAQETQGAFDVTVGPYVRLWRRARRQHRLPTEAQLARARESVGYHYLELNPSTQSVRLIRPQMRLDLGGIAAGYAVDEALRTLKSRGIHRALVDASGDICVGDPPPGRTGWTIAVDLNSSAGGPSYRVELANAAITTSGDMFQYVEIDGKRYSHIVDPKTGLGMTNHKSATVVAQDCITADSLATALCVLDIDSGRKLVESRGGVAAVVSRMSGDEIRVTRVGEVAGLRALQPLSSGVR